MRQEPTFGRAAKPAGKAPDPVARNVVARPIAEAPSQSLRTQPGVAPPSKAAAKAKPRKTRRERGAAAAPDEGSGRRRGKRNRKSAAANNPVVVFGNFLFTAMILGIVGAGVALYAGNRSFEGAGPLAQDSTFTVAAGSSLGEIAGGLERAGMITNAEIFEVGARAHGNGSAFRHGEYAVQAGASMKTIMDTMVSGAAILHPLTVVEGTTVFQAWQRIAGHDMLAGDMPEQMPPEGMLMADTQKFSRGTTRAELVDRMVAQQVQLVAQVWETRQPDLPVNTMAEFMTLASIVEKETAVAGERPLVAGVFVNRLRRGMRLQSDPTIIYGLFGGEGMPSGRPIYQSDIESRTPYNTYVIGGLPPGPIAIPGRAALEAVANPAETDALYFVADGTGGHAFATTLDEHNANVRRWREIRRQREAEAESAQN